jgi:hypothetical protein
MKEPDVLENVIIFSGNMKKEYNIITQRLGWQYSGMFRIYIVIICINKLHIDIDAYKYTYANI